MSAKKYSIILGNLGNTRDRFCAEGYKENVDTYTMLQRAASIPQVSGVELVGTWDDRPDKVREMKRRLRDLNLVCASIIPDHFSQPIWGQGAFTSRDKTIRRKAVDATFEACEMAEALGCKTLNIWNGQDGYDYPLQADYNQERDWLANGVRVCAEKFPSIRFALEYKPKEPRTHSYLARMADTLLVSQEVGLKNVGVCIDVGHSFVAGEDAAEAALLAQRAGNRLFRLRVRGYISWRSYATVQG
jgi:xylose isomerase